jgi:hypothetical protein
MDDEALAAWGELTAEWEAVATDAQETTDDLAAAGGELTAEAEAVADLFVPLAQFAPLARLVVQVEPCTWRMHRHVRAPRGRRVRSRRCSRAGPSRRSADDDPHDARVARLGGCASVFADGRAV